MELLSFYVPMRVYKLLSAIRTLFHRKVFLIEQNLFRQLSAAAHTEQKTLRAGYAQGEQVSHENGIQEMLVDLSTLFLWRNELQQRNQHDNL